MAKVKKSREKLLMEHMFPSTQPNAADKIKAIDLDKIAERMAEVPLTPVPKKRLVSERIIEKDPDQRCMDILARNWDILRGITAAKEGPYRTFRGYNSEDVMHETYEYVSRDERVKGATEEEIIGLFTQRFMNLMWVAKKDRILERMLLAAVEINPEEFKEDNSDNEVIE